MPKNKVLNKITIAFFITMIVIIQFTLLAIIMITGLCVFLEDRIWVSLITGISICIPIVYIEIIVLKILVRNKYNTQIEIGDNCE